MRFSWTSPLWTSAVAVSLLAMFANAQTTLPDLSTATVGTASSTRPAATSTGSSNTGTRTGSASSSGAVITGSGVSGQATTAPSISGSASGAVTGLPTGLPTLSGGYVVVAPSVPPTANAPYMQTSNLPEGTVFIVVGALLGFMAMSVLLWRGLVAWSLHRSVKRAAQMQSLADTKALFRTPAPPSAFYKYSDRDSTISLSGLTPKGGKRHTRPTTGSNAHGSNVPSNLFFSPTATAAGAGLATPGNRGSNYLPAGYYASGAAAPAGGAGQVSIGHNATNSVSNLSQHAAGYNRASMGPSPPESPAYNSDRNSRYGASSSTLDLNRGYGGHERVPSAYLEDLINDPASLPQPGQQSHNRGNSGSPLRDRR